MMKIPFLALAAICAASANATLVNAGFEDPLQTPGGFSSNGINGWSTSVNAAAGVWRIPSGGFFVANPPEGLQIGYSNGLFVTQQSDNVLDIGTTTLTVMGGRRTDSFAGSFMLRLWAGGTVANGVVTGGTMLGETLYDHTAHAPSTFDLVTVEYTALAGDASLNKLLTVQFERTAGQQMNFDDVKLSAESVPEPVSMVALAAGALALCRRRRS